MTLPLAAIDIDLATERVKVLPDRILVLPSGGAADEAQRLFGTASYAADALAAGKPLVLLAGTYTISTDVTAPPGLVLEMQYGAAFSVASGKTLTLTSVTVRALTTYTGGSGTTTGGGVVFGVSGGAIAFYGGTPHTKQAITGALSTVSDAPAKAVLTSIIAALKGTAGVNLVTDSTT